MTITEQVQEALKHNNQIAVFAARGSGKTTTYTELYRTLPIDALSLDNVDTRFKSMALGRDLTYREMLDLAKSNKVDIVLLGTPCGSYNPDSFGPEWTKITIAP